MDSQTTTTSLSLSRPEQLRGGFDLGRPPLLGRRQMPRARDLVGDQKTRSGDLQLHAGKGDHP